MGLDQFAYKRTASAKSKKSDYRYLWYNHNKLHQWMAQRFEDRIHCDVTLLNCGELELFSDDIRALKKVVQASSLPTSNPDLTFGKDDQVTIAKENLKVDLEFCDWAQTQIAAGHQVFYSCWW